MILLLWLACATPEPLSEIDLAPQASELAECAVCGMVVREQPAPRGQVVLKSGDHLHFCGVGDLRAWLDAPTALGAPVATYIEALPDEQLAVDTNTAPHDWVRAEDLWFVFGAKRPGVMGLPALTFVDSEAARAHAQALQTSPVRWDDVRRAPFNTVPIASPENP